MLYLISKVPVCNRNNNRGVRDNIMSTRLQRLKTRYQWQINQRVPKYLPNVTRSILLKIDATTNYEKFRKIEQRLITNAAQGY